MDDLEDELDLRYHRGLKPDVYYRCPTLESLDGALRNELDKNAASLVPVEIVTEFVLAVASTITIPVAQQSALDALIQPADYPQSMTVEYALCRDTDGKDRLKVQRAIARSIIAAIQKADGFKYTERSAQSKEGGDGARLKYVCQDSLQNRDRKSRLKAENEVNSGDSEDQPKKSGRPLLPTYDCGGAIHIKFSIKRKAINVVYKHNPIHSSPVIDESFSQLAGETDPIPRAKTANGAREGKRKDKKKDQIDVENDYQHVDLNMSTSPEAPKTLAKTKRKDNATLPSSDSSRKSGTKKTKTSKDTLSPSAQNKAQIRDTSPPLVPVKGKACIWCREKKIKCNKAKPTCNQCRRGLWTCQYELLGVKKRSKNSCVNCKTRKRKCTEERPSCAHCLRLDDDCEYADYS